METVTEKQVLTTEELQSLSDHQKQSQLLIFELGEIELIKIQMDERYKKVKETLSQLNKDELNISNSLTQKYGKISLNYETGEYTKLD
jgi:hypothetical protein